METIKVYLDNMFLNIPDSEQVQKIKSELYDMMEDKYHELISAGKPENEAVGIVISEFGNLEELKEELGLTHPEEQIFSDGNTEWEEKEKTMEKEESAGKKNKKKGNKKKSKDQEEAERRWVSFDEVEDYLQAVAVAANCIGVGVMLCVWSPAALIALSEQGGWGVALGLALLFVFVAAGVGLFILNGTKLEQFKYLKTEVFGLDPGIEQFIREEQEAFHQPFVLQVAIGVVLCILSPVQLVVCSILEFPESLILFSVGMLLILVGIGCFFLVRAGMRKDAYHVLLQEESYRKEKKTGFLKVFDSLYWLIVTAIYLNWSFRTGSWGISWLIWAIAGVLYEPLTRVLKGKSFFR